MRHGVKRPLFTVFNRDTAVNITPIRSVRIVKNIPNWHPEYSLNK